MIMKNEKPSKKQSNTHVTPEKVKTFILNNIVLTKDRNIQVQLEYMRDMGIVVLFISLLFFYIVHSQGLSEEIGRTFFAIYFYTTILLSIFLGFLAVKIKKKAINNINNVFDGKKVPNRKGYVGGGGLAGGIGFIIASRLDLSDNVRAFFITIVASLFIMMFTFLISSNQYELYLLKKYCPEIAYLEVDDVIPKKTAMPKNKKKK